MQQVKGKSKSKAKGRRVGIGSEESRRSISRCREAEEETAATVAQNLISLRS